MKRNYPCILDSGAYTWLAYDHENGIALNDNLKKYKGNISFDSDPLKDVTADYLRNTYGKVDSKEHSEFIVKLAESAGFSQCHNAKAGEAMSFMFYSDGEFGIYDKTHNELVNMQDRKLITLPLPPKESEEVEVVDGGICEATKSSSAIHELESIGCKFANLSWISPNANKSPDIEEWPQVGDEVLTKSSQPAIVRGFHGCNVWIEYQGNAKQKGYNTVSISTLKKSPAPEEDLAAHIANAADSDDIHSTHVMIAKAIINGEIKGLEYKPQ